MLPEGLTDGVVRLRAFEAGDAPAVTVACLDPLIQRFTTFPTSEDVSAARGWIEAQPALRRRGEALDLAILRAGDDSLLGAVGMGNFSWPDRRAEGGFWLAPEARGKGLAARALRLLSDWAFGEPLDLARIVLSIDAENLASQRTAERVGFEREGVLRSHIEAKARRWDVAIYGKLRCP